MFGSTFNLVTCVRLPFLFLFLILVCFVVVNFKFCVVRTMHTIVMIVFKFHWHVVQMLIKQCLKKFKNSNVSICNGSRELRFKF